MASSAKKANRYDIAGVEKRVVIDAPISDVWEALTDPAAIGSWMGDGSVKIDLKKGGAYELFSGDTTGYFTDIEKPNVLEYSWRMSEWDSAWPDSLVRWELQPQGRKTKVRLTHVNFPNLEERNGHEEGWDTYFLGPMKEWLESDN